MIWESGPWKNELLANARLLEQYAKSKRRSERRSFGVERTIFLSTYVMRKLWESGKLSSSWEKRKVPCIFHPPKARTPDRLSIVGSRSEKVLKIGSSDTPWDRGPHLNILGYGGVSDWKILYYASFPDAGKVEFNVHSALSTFASPRKYFREGVETDCREIFACA
jgi:hypothetical protein